jgi:hypothetical protein
MPNGCAVVLGIAFLIALFTWIGGIYGFIASFVVIGINFYMFSGGKTDK